MTPLFQNDPELLPVIQSVGCFFRCAIRMAEKELGENLTAEEINYEWETAQQKGYIDKQNNLKNAAKVATDCLRRYGGCGAFVEVATKTDQAPGWYSWVTNRRADYRIKKINQAGPNKTHFVLADQNGSTEWDPHIPEIHSLGTVYTVCYRFDKD